jgi:hypothetical protein
MSYDRDENSRSIPSVVARDADPFVVIYNRFSKPSNRLQTAAAKTAGKLDGARVLQAS